MTTENIDTIQYLLQVLNSMREDVAKLVERMTNVEKLLIAQSPVEQSSEATTDVKKRRRGRPSKNDRPLHDYVMEVLETSNEPLTAKEIADLVLEKGYVTEAKTAFANIVLHALTVSADFRKATRGKRRPIRYTLNN